MRISHRRSSTGAALTAVLLSACLLAGCTVLTVDEDRAIRARRGGAFNAARYVAEIWDSKAAPMLDARAVPLDRLIPALSSGLNRAGASLGRRVGEGSAWTFVVRGSGRIAALDTASPQGIATLAVTPKSTIKLQIGPVIEGTAIRDALPFIAFDDFADQLAFADVGRALTARSIDRVRPTVMNLRPGQLIRFVGVTNVREPSETLIVTPIRIAIEHGS